MESIVKPPSGLAGILGEQKKDENTKYRLSKYVYEKPVEDGLLLYNTMTLELLLLSPEEAENRMHSDELIKKWFLVPEDMDDMKFATQLKDIILTFKETTDNIYSYKIFTTTHCNARCYYCFEKNFTNKKTMTKETADKVVEYIISHCNNERVRIEWFGGEPLVNTNAMDWICEGLRDAGINFYSVMITNGYLIDQEMIQEKMKGLWNLRTLQITLDGTEETYNSIKAYVNVPGSPFQKVFENIELLIQEGADLTITMNVSTDNFEDQMKLADLLNERLAKYGRENVCLLVSPIVGVEGYNPQNIDGQARISIMENVEVANTVREKVQKLGFHTVRSIDRLPRAARTIACVAEPKCGNVTILPDGTTGFCGCIPEGETFGSVWNDEEDEELIRKWQEYVPADTPVCKDCLCYPKCLWLKKCPDATCSESLRTYVESNTKNAVLEEYRFYKANQQK